MGALIAVVDKKGGDATATAVTMLGALSSAGTGTFGMASASCVKSGRAIDALRKPSLNSSIVIGRKFPGIPHSGEPQPIMLKNAAIVFEGRIYPPKEIFHIKHFALDLQEHAEEAAKNFIERTFGDYAFVLAEPTRLVAGRDSVGVCPLYYGENAGFAALASERKALWKIGIDKTYSFPPGHVAVIDQKSFRLKPVKTLSYSEPTPMTMHDAARKLETLLRRSVTQRVSALKEVAVAFSGGLDSSIIALFAKKNRCHVQLIHVSLEGQKETDHARKAAEILKLPIHIQLFKEEDVQEDLQKVLSLIEEADPVKTSIGIPIYWASEQAAEMGLEVVLAGQGADELFGGYRRYVDDYSLGGEEKVRKRLFDDVVEIYKNNLERDAKICSFHNVELRLPFATFEMAEFAASLPVNLKIDPQRDSIRKLVLRKAAENAGLPEPISKKPKKAVQYATGVDKALKKMAKRHGVSVKTFLKRTFSRIFEEAI
jgi:asparagine synthase (glutamine-hydrolysing)